MAESTNASRLVGLGAACAGATTAEELLDAALPVLLAVSGAEAVLVVGVEGPHLDVARSCGAALDAADLPRSVVDGVLPDAWRGAVARLAAYELAGHAGTLVVAWTSTDEQPGEPDTVGVALALLHSGLVRVQTSADLADLESRVDNAQHLAQMGDYDWHIPTDTNRWSDELFRIYGHEPGSFQPSYDMFLSLIHPDDRARITGVHQQAYATGEPFSMVERIVRPDGEIRHLSSNGEVLMGADGTPVRMRGTCVDITDRVLAERARGQLAARMRALVDSSPEAILVLDPDGTVLEANARAHDLLAGDPVGRAVEEVLSSQESGLGVTGRRLDGRPVSLDVTTAAVHESDGAPGERELMAVFLRDAAAREAGEALAARFGEAKLRRRQALEINDNVVQGLVAAAYALDSAEVSLAASYVERTLDSARAMMDDLLEPLDGEDLAPGDLVRRTPASIGPPRTEQTDLAQAAEPGRETHRVLVVDDAEDLRALLRMRLERAGGWTVVGEAADGRSAIEQARALQPELVLLDLAMPGMDGLEALPHIREAVPGVRVVVFSGFNHATLAQQALEAGADRYAVKGGSLHELLELLGSVVATR